MIAYVRSEIRHSWVHTLAYGLGLYAAVTAATAATDNVHASRWRG